MIDRESLRIKAMQWLMSPPDRRPMARHAEVIWGNFADAFDSRDEFDIMVNRKLFLLKRKETLRGGETASHLAHNQEAAGSTPAPATLGPW